MKVIGFSGGGSICELGSISDVVLFFDCLEMFSKWKYPSEDWSLLTDRLYRRYLRFEELDAASERIGRAKILFSELPVSAVEWNDNFLRDAEKTRLSPSSATTLLDVFGKYFSLFFHCAESAKISYDSFKSYPGYQYQPVRLIPTDNPWAMLEHQRSLNEYDELGPNDLPFWRR